MKCGEIIGMTIEKFEGELSPKRRKQFDKHIEKCAECRKKYYLISANYETDYNLIFNKTSNMKFKQSELINNVMNSLDASRYERSMPITFKAKWALISMIVVFSVSITAFAKPIYKSLEELLETISRKIPEKAIEISEDENLKRMTVTEKESIQKSISDAKNLYEKYKGEVDKIANEMKTGEIRTLTFEGERDDFYISIGKGMETKTVIYGIRGIPGHFYKGDIPIEYASGREIYSQLSLQDLIDQDYFTPVPEKLSDGYELSSATLSKGQLSTLRFKNTKSNSINDYVSIYLYTDKVDIDDKTIKSLELINDHQAIYLEEEIADKQYGKYTIYLGENKRQKVLTIQAQLIKGVFEKTDLQSIAQSIKYYNPESNEITYNGYFKNITNAIPKQKLDEFYEMIQKGEKNIRINLQDNVQLSRKEGSGKSETYYIEYSGNDTTKIGQYSNYPLLMNLETYEKCELEGFSIIGWGYRWDKEISFSVVKKGVNKLAPEFVPDDYFRNSLVRITARTLDTMLKQYPVFDIVIKDYVGSMNNEYRNEELLFDKDNNPYIVTDSVVIDSSTGMETVTGRYFRTVKEVAGDYVHYNIIIPNALLNGMSDYEFINGLCFIE